MSPSRRRTGRSSTSCGRSARLPVIPPTIEHAARKPAAVRELYRRYERLNPGWRDGEALLMLAPADRRAFANVLRRSWERMSGR